MYSEEKVFKKMVERRRDFHRYPETGWAEFRTTSKIAETLTDVGMNIRFAGEFVEMEHVLGRNADIEAQIGRAVSQGASPEIIEKMKGLTGLTAEIDTGRPGPVTAIRFDIDCV